MNRIYSSSGDWFEAEAIEFPGDDRVWVFVGEGVENNSAKLPPKDAVNLLRNLADAIEGHYGLDDGTQDS